MRAQYLQDWIVDPKAPLTWRLDKAKAGSGALGDIGAHIIDLAQYITGERLTGVSALLETFVERAAAVAGERPGSRGTAPAPGRGPVTVDDAAVFLGRLDRRRDRRRSRPPGSRSAARTRMRIEINGSHGSAGVRLREHECRCSTTTAREPGRRRRASPHPGDRADASRTWRLVAPRPPPRLRARLHPPGRRPGQRRSPRHHRPPVLRRRPAVQRVLAAVEASSAAAPAAAGTIHLTDEETLTMARPITLFTGQWADLPFEEVAGWPPGGATTDSRSPAGATTSTSGGRGGRRLHRRPQARSWKVRLAVYAISNHLKGQAVCDDPIDERHRDILPDRIWGDGDAEGVRQRAAEEMKMTARTAARARRRHGRRLHRVVDLEVRRDVPAGVAGA